MESRVQTCGHGCPHSGKGSCPSIYCVQSTKSADSIISESSNNCIIETASKNMMTYTHLKIVTIGLQKPDVQCDICFQLVCQGMHNKRHRLEDLLTSLNLVSCNRMFAKLAG